MFKINNKALFYFINIIKVSLVKPTEGIFHHFRMCFVDLILRSHYHDSRRD